MQSNIGSVVMQIDQDWTQIFKLGNCNHLMIFVLKTEK